MHLDNVYFKIINDSTECFIYELPYLLNIKLP